MPSFQMKIDENDHLTFQLYNASKKPSVRKSRITGWIITTTTFLLMGLLFLQQNNTWAARYFFVLSGITLVFYPFYSRWRYKNHYRKHVRETFKNSFDDDCTLDIREESIITRDNGSEVKVSTDQILEISEIRDYYFIKIRSGASFIIPKLKVDNLARMEQDLKMLVDKKVIPFNVDLDWKWK